MSPFHEDNTALGSFTHGISHEGNKFTSLNKRLSLSNKMRDVDEADFSKTASLALTAFGVKIYFAGVSNGSTDVINWGSYVATYMCQFRSFVDNNTQTPVITFTDNKTNNTVSISASTENKQQAAREFKQKSESSQKESKLTEPTSGNDKKQAFTQYGQEYVLVLKNDHLSSSSSTPSNGTSFSKSVGPSGDPRLSLLVAQGS